MLGWHIFWKDDDDDDEEEDDVLYSILSYNKVVSRLSYKTKEENFPIVGMKKKRG